MTRRRRSAEEAREEILAIAEELLRAQGPDGLRLDDVAERMGVSRQAVLHHYGTREDLLREVVRRAWLGLFEDLQGLAGETATFQPADFLDRVDEVTRQRGNARLGAWLLLSGEGLPESLFEGALAGLPAGLADAAGLPREDAQFVLLLVGAALFGDAIFGERLRQALGLPDGEQERAAFRRWLVATLWKGRTDPAGPGRISAGDR